MANIYHYLYRLPFIERDGMLVDIEGLALQLVQSGRLRIDADPRINFARFILPEQHVSLIFSWRELTDPQLLPDTEEVIRRSLGERGQSPRVKNLVQSHVERLKAQIQKYRFIEEDIEMRIARVMVQCAHPSVIALLLIERVEIYVSFSFTIGDMLDIPTWRTQSSNSGMQSTDGHNAAIFVSCGGDPFAQGEPGMKYGDGFPSLARMMVIAGQELGHYADIRRNPQGRQIGRYSANFSATEATDIARIGRLQDMATVKALYARMNEGGLQYLYTVERRIRFYKKMKRRLHHYSNRLWHYLIVWRFVAYCRRQGLSFIEEFAGHPYVGHMMEEAVWDMAFNLAPEADAYRSHNKREEEAIACVEAVARVPQQANKWGHVMTRTMMPHLYVLYYKEIIPGCVRAVEALSGRAFTIRTLRYPRSLWKRLKYFVKKPSWPTKIPIFES